MYATVAPYRATLHIKLFISVFIVFRLILFVHFVQRNKTFVFNEAMLPIESRRFSSQLDDKKRLFLRETKNHCGKRFT